MKKRPSASTGCTCTRENLGDATVDTGSTWLTWRFQITPSNLCGQASREREKCVYISNEYNDYAMNKQITFYSCQSCRLI